MTPITKANFVGQREFEQLIASNELVVAEHTASWCSACSLITPLIDKLATEYSERVNVVKVDISKSPDNTINYGILDIPAVLIFRNGELIQSLFGLQPYENFSNILEAQLKL